MKIVLIISGKGGFSDMAVKLLHTSDLHIDWLFNKFSPSARTTRRRELLQVLDMICELAINEEVDAMLISGDLFHSNQVDQVVLTRVWLSLEKVTDKGIPVIILPGNHDEQVEKMLQSIGDYNPLVQIFANDGEVFDKIDGLTVYGVPYSAKDTRTSPLTKIKKLDRPGIHVAMVHGTVKTLPIIEDNYSPITNEQIAESGLDYIALGHYHNFQNCSTGTVRAYYPGSPNILSFDCAGERYALVVDIGDQGVRVTPYAIPSRPYCAYELKMTGKSLPEIFRQIEKWFDKEACVKLILKGIVELDCFPLKHQLIEQYASEFFHLEIEEDTMLVPAEDLNEQTIKGIFVRKVNERLRNEYLTEEDRLILLETLRVGLAAIEGRRLG